MADKAAKGKARRPFRCTACVCEDHEKPLYGVAFCSGGPGYDSVFATVGSNRVTVYELLDTGEIGVVQVYEDEDKEEELYACAWTVDQPSGEPLLAVGGVRGVVKVINASRQEVARTLVGHGAMINDVKWHPITPSMLLTASKDESIRLWNVATNTCVAVFAGEAGHRDDVLSVSIHPIGNCFASAGMDNTVKIWALDSPDVTSAMQASYSHKVEGSAVFKTHFEQFPAYSTANVHVDYVDYVQWVGNLLVSKSTDSKLLMWAPDTLTGADAVMVLSEFEMRDAHVWFMRGAVSPDASLLACGNEKATLHVWELFPEAARGAGDSAEAVLNPPPAVFEGRAISGKPGSSGAASAEAPGGDGAEPLAPRSLQPTKFATLPLTSVDGMANTVRGCAWSPDGQTLVAVCDNATVWRWDLLKPRPAPTLQDVLPAGQATDTKASLDALFSGHS